MTTDDRAVDAPGLYFYGLVLPEAELPQGLVGIDDQPVRAVPLDSVSALVSDAPTDREIGLPADVRDHARVLDSVAGAVSVLPVRFGTMADEGHLSDAVPADRQRRHSDGLRALEGVVQLTLTARYREEAVLAELVAEDPEIRRLRDATRGRSEMATYDARLRLGELVVAGFDRRRPGDADLVRRAVEPLVQEVEEREVTQTAVVVNLALLVRRDDVTRVEDALEAVGERLADRITLRLVGPQAPYDFVEEV